MERPEEQRDRVEEVGGGQDLQGEHRNAQGAGHGGPKSQRSAGEGREEWETCLRRRIEEGAKVREAKGQGGMLHGIVLAYRGAAVDLAVRGPLSCSRDRGGGRSEELQVVGGVGVRSDGGCTTRGLGGHAAE